MANANPMDSSKWWDLMSSHWEELLQPGQMQKLQMDPGRLRSDGRFSRFGTQMHQRFVVNASLWGEPRWFGSWKDQNRVPSIASAVRFWGISVDRMPRWSQNMLKDQAEETQGVVISRTGHEASAWPQAGAFLYHRSWIICTDVYHWTIQL